MGLKAFRGIKLETKYPLPVNQFKTNKILFYSLRYKGIKLKGYMAGRNFHWSVIAII